MIEDSEAGTKDSDDEAEAAQHDKGQDQKPKQAEEESTGLFDSSQHSDAPGPFGTGEPEDPDAPEGDDE